MDANFYQDSDFPLSYRDSQQQNPSASRRSYRFSPNRSPSSSPPTRPLDTPFSRQNRRLQLRNAGFRGGLLPTVRSISPQVSNTWRSFSSQSERADNIENSGVDYGPSEKKLHEPGSISQRNSIGVLQEIENSSQRRKQQHQRAGVSNLFQASSQSRPPSSNSRPKTPLLEPFSPETAMRPRDLSPLDCRTPGPLDRQKRQVGSARMVSHGTSRYIEHLETQLAASLNRTGVEDSPIASNYAHKYKALSAEHKMLKQDLAEWEEHFEERVKDEIAVMMDRESQLRSKIRVLERDAETKDTKIRELQWEIDMDRQRLRGLEAVKSTNRSLEKRVDVLTELLAQSPARSETGPKPESECDPMSPEHRRNPRPKSLFTRLPLSPIRQSHIQPLVTPESDQDPVDDTPDSHHEQDEVPQLYSDFGGPMSAVVSLDSEAGESCSPSTHQYNSQRSSMISHLSGSTMWGNSHPIPFDLPRRHRRMRRFPSGSLSLKPLILPAASSLLSSSPSCNSYGTEELNHSRNYSTDDWHCPSNFVQAHEETLNALEGKTHQYQSFEEAMAGHDLDETDDHISENSVYEHSVESDCFPDGHLHTPGFFETPTRHVDHDLDPKKTPCDGTLSDSCSPATMTVVTHHGSHRRKKRRRNSSPCPDISPHIVRQFRTANLGTGCGFAATCGYSRWFRDIISGSIILAKRILSNSWHSNWKSIGKIPWWVLGLVFGTQTRDEWFRKSLRSHAAWLPLDRTTSEMGSPVLLVEDANMTIRGPPKTRLSIQEMKKKRTETGSSVEQNCAEEHDLSSQPTPLLKLWAKFSLAIALAIGLAIKDGPASLMCSCTTRELSDNFMASEKPINVARRHEQPSQEVSCIQHSCETD